MTTTKVTVDFLTAFSDVNNANGLYDDERFTALLLPLRAMIMDLDGVVDCSVRRYGMAVEYLPDLVDECFLKAHIARSIERLVNLNKTSRLTIGGRLLFGYAVGYRRRAEVVEYAKRTVAELSGLTRKEAYFPYRASDKVTDIISFKK